MNNMNNELYEKLSRLQWLRHKLHMRDYAGRGPLADPTRGQGRILAILKLQDGIPTKDLSYLLGIHLSSLNELLAKMEKGGYITREPSEADKRVMLVKLTQKGRDEQQLESNPGDIFSCLLEEEKVTFGNYLDRITVALRTDMGLSDTDDDFDDERKAHLAFMERGRFGPRGGFGGFPRGDFGRFSRGDLSGFSRGGRHGSRPKRNNEEADQ